MKKQNNAIKKVPVATIALPVKQKVKRATKGLGKRKGHYEWVTMRYRTEWRTGSGTRITSETFETYREWVKDTQSKGGR